MALAETSGRGLPPEKCPPLLPVRFIVRPWPDGAGRIQFCRAPYVCKTWRPGEPIPNDWAEVAPPSLAAPITKCDVRFGGSPSQAAALAIARGEAAAASRLPRTPRQARTPRLPRLARQPRKPRARRRSRPARRPRLPRRRPPRAQRVPMKFYCYYEYKEVEHKTLLAVSHTGPWTEEQHKATLARHPTVRAIEVPKSASCPDLSQSECARQAAAFVRPLQRLVGWKRPEYATPEEALVQRRARRPLAPPVAAPPPSTYQQPDPGTTTCLKNTAFNWWDCYDNASGTLVWSNHTHGPWAGQPMPPPGAIGAGLGA